MKAKKAVFECQGCGAQYPKWQGKCASCEQWNTIAEVSAEVMANQRLSQALDENKLVKLNEIDVEGVEQKRTLGLDYIDRVLGGGLPPASVVLLAGAPGAGKSSLLFQLIQNRRAKTLYVSAEESAQQVALRFRKNKPSDVYVLTDPHLSSILSAIEKLKPDFVAIDSIQMVLAEKQGFGGGIAGLREVAEQLVQHAKHHAYDLWVVGHITKDGDIAGPKALEHLVDTVLTFSLSDQLDYRVLQTQKHRFGRSGEIAVLKMDSDGLHEVPAAESFWLQNQETLSVGCSHAAALLGSRVFCVEVQALVVSTNFPSPRRSATGYESSRLHLLLAVLEKHLRLPLSQLDVYLKIVGGLKINEPALDFAVAAAICSAIREQPLSPQSVFAGELSLTGELRPIVDALRRYESCRQIGKNEVYLPAAHKELKGKPGFKGVQRLKDLYDSIFDPT